VEEYGGYLAHVHTDCGTENVTIAAIQGVSHGKLLPVFMVPNLATRELSAGGHFNGDTVLPPNSSNLHFHLTTTCCLQVLQHLRDIHITFTWHSLDLRVTFLTQSACFKLTIHKLELIQATRLSLHVTLNTFNDIRCYSCNHLSTYNYVLMCIYGLSSSHPSNPWYYCTWCYITFSIYWNYIVMATLCNRGAIIFLPCSFFPSSFYLFFFPRLISAAVDRMSAILLHMAWP